MTTMENDKKNWTIDEINFLIENYELKGSKYCSDFLKRKTKAVIVKAKRLGLKSARNSFRYSKEYLQPLIENSNTIKEVLEKMGLRAAGGNYGVLKKYIKLFDINIEHIKEFANENNRIFGLAAGLKQIPLKDCLIENSNYNRSSLKKRLYKEGLKKRECELCGQNEIWNGKKMSLILDHKNGIHNDNRLENLRIVCPNCNATLETHAGKNKRK